MSERSGAAPACTVTLVPGGEQAQVKPGTLLIAACRRAGVEVPNLCGNRGLCTTCSAEIIEGLEHLDPPTRTERRMLEWIGAPPHVRLTCQPHVLGDVVLRAAISPIERLDYDPSDLPWT